MKEYRTSDAVQLRVEKRRGQCDTHISARGSALVVIDMQRYFVDPAFSSSVADAVNIIPAINCAAEAMRSGGGEVIWVRTTSRGALQTWQRHHTFGLNPDAVQRRLAGLSPGSVGHAFHADLDIRETDQIVEKVKFSALSQGSSDLQSKLIGQNIANVFVAGTLTNVCCDSTARDAMMLDFRAAMLSDACAALTDEEHHGALDTFQLYFGPVFTVDAACAMWMSGK